MTRLSGKVAIITGSSGGIGKTAAMIFAKEGADVVIHYRSKESEAKELVEKITEIGRKALLARVDFDDISHAEKEVQKMVDFAIKEFNRVDVLVNLAGYPASGEWNKKLFEITAEDFFKPLNVDLFGSFLCAKAVAPHMIRQEKGVIVNVSSTPALAGHDKGFAFTVAKAAIIGLTKALAFELAPFVRVNTIALGNVETAWTHELNSKELSAAQNENLIRRFGSQEEIAKTLVFLCGDDSTFINGQTIVLDGDTILH
ncbi:MAG TPA: SDR family oxidoreductase [Candidatus Bathyarchaeia archaeon]|nr:SDR family oxidoreductase [Candidatus Bathyarchaeia archaeon]